MVSKASIVSMWKLLGAFNPEDGSGRSGLGDLRDLVIDLAFFDITGQDRISSEEMLALSFVHDRILAIECTLSNDRPFIDKELDEQVVERGLIGREHILSPEEADALAERDSFLFRVWALSQVEQVLEQLGEERPGEEAV